MCHSIGFPQDGQLDEATLSKMKKEERAFWEDFLEEAMTVFKENGERGEEEPYNPPPSLKKKFKTAIRRYRGDRYCQVKQLRSVFSF
jgi:hypothetical protein